MSTKEITKCYVLKAYHQAENTRDGKTYPASSTVQLGFVGSKANLKLAEGVDLAKIQGCIGIEGVATVEEEFVSDLIYKNDYNQDRKGCGFVCTKLLGFRPLGK